VAKTEVKFERIDNGIWYVVIDGQRVGKAVRHEDGKWVGVYRGTRLPGRFGTRREAGSEVKIESAPDR
jgi:hypothetical protein